MSVMWVRRYHSDVRAQYDCALARNRVALPSPHRSRRNFV